LDRLSGELLSAQRIDSAAISATEFEVHVDAATGVLDSLHVVENDGSCRELTASDNELLFATHTANATQAVSPAAMYLISVGSVWAFWASWSQLLAEGLDSLQQGQSAGLSPFEQEYYQGVANSPY